MDNNIIIDITESYDAKNFSIDKGLIQQESKDAFFELLDNNLNNIISCNSFQRVHNAIIIDGERGTGKTSFILSMQNYIKSSTQYNNKIEVLDIIDPTLIETKENVLITVIASIKEKIHKKVKLSNVENDYYLSNWKSSLKKLSTGLSLLDGVGINEYEDRLWNDPALVLEEGLNRAKHGGSLERDLHNYLIESLNILEKDAFLLTFDDIDTSADRGKPILEIIRKYFTSPKLITVILGDMKIYTLISREIQWEKLNPQYTNKYNNEFINEKYKREIEILSEQYLLKILKPENRISLKSIKKKKKTLAIKYENSTDEKISKFLEKFIEDVFFEYRKDKQIVYLDLFLSMPIRTLLQVMRAYNKSLISKNHKNLLRSLSDIFLETLLTYKGLVDLLKVLLTNRNDSVSKLSLFLLENDLIENEFRLYPEYENNNKNIMLAILNAYTSYDLQQNPHKIFEFFIKICLPRESLIEWIDRSKIYKDKNKTLSKDEIIDLMIKYTGLNTMDNPLRISRKFTSILNHENNQHTKFNRGTIFLSNTVYKVELNNIYNKSNFFNPIINEVEFTNGRFRYLSFYSIFAICSIFLNDNDDINKHKQIVSFRSFYNNYLPNEDSFQEEADLEDDTEIENINIKMNNMKFNIYVLASIWIRFIYNLKNIDDFEKFNSTNEILQMYKKVFLNSVLVETLKEFNITKDLKLNSIKQLNYIDKPQNDAFKRNLEIYEKNLNEEKKHQSLFYNINNLFTNIKIDDYITNDDFNITFKDLKEIRSNSDAGERVELNEEYFSNTILPYMINTSEKYKKIYENLKEKDINPMIQFITTKHKAKLGQGLQRGAKEKLTKILRDRLS